VLYWKREYVKSASAAPDSMHSTGEDVSQVLERLDLEGNRGDIFELHIFRVLIERAGNREFAFFSYQRLPLSSCSFSQKDELASVAAVCL